MLPTQPGLVTQCNDGSISDGTQVQWWALPLVPTMPRKLLPVPIIRSVSTPVVPAVKQAAQVGLLIRLVVARVAGEVSVSGEPTTLLSRIACIPRLIPPMFPSYLIKLPLITLAGRPRPSAARRVGEKPLQVRAIGVPPRAPYDRQAGVVVLGMTMPLAPYRMMVAPIELSVAMLNVPTALC